MRQVKAPASLERVDCQVTADMMAETGQTDLRSFLSLLGSTRPTLSSESPELAVMVLTLNETAFTRLLAYTGLDGEQLIRAVPSLSPRAISITMPS